MFTALALLRNNANGLAAFDGTGAQQLATEAAYNLVGEADDLRLVGVGVDVPVEHVEQRPRVHRHCAVRGPRRLRGERCRGGRLMAPGLP